MNELLLVLHMRLWRDTLKKAELLGDEDFDNKRPEYPILEAKVIFAS